MTQKNVANLIVSRHLRCRDQCNKRLSEPIYNLTVNKLIILSIVYQHSCTSQDNSS